MNILYQVAVRNVFRNRRRSLFTLSAIAIGLAVVLIITAVSNAFYRFSIENAVNVKIGALQIHKSGYLSNVSLNQLSFHFQYGQELLRKVESVAGVKAASGRIAFRGLVSNGRNQALFFANGVDVEREQKVCPRWLGTLTEGSQPLLPSDTGQAMVGQELARSLNVAPKGALIRSVVSSETSQQTEPGEFLNLSGSSPQGRQNAIDVQVKATTKSLLPLEEKRSITLPLSAAQSLLGLTGEVTEIAVAVHDLDHLEAVQQRLQAAMGSEFEVSLWSDVQPFLRDVLFRQKVLIGIVSFILFILVLFVIANTMTMAVFERTREIGTMLSVGIKKNQIQRIFFSEAIFVGIIGALAGLLLGLIVVLVLKRIGIPFGSEGFEEGMLYPFLQVPFSCAAFIAAVFCAALAGLFPARRASNMNPVDALRA
ncbi:ABC transporter permease [bacterium]|nr:ABC transporter permease [bacterium]